VTQEGWDRFVASRESYRSAVADWTARLPSLPGLQGALLAEKGGPSYTIDTPIVFNRDLDLVDRGSEPALILIADNPGRREQSEENRRYLVGPSGKLADRFFREHPELGIDFKRDVLILNKTPIHTPRTADLRRLKQLGGPELAALIEESQVFCARFAASVDAALRPREGVWIVGYSELHSRGLFAPFSEELVRLYGDGGLHRIRLFRHFSMNQFSADVRAKALEGEPVGDTLRRMGTDYRRRILGGPPCS